MEEDRWLERNKEVSVYYGQELPQRWKWKHIRIQFYRDKNGNLLVEEEEITNRWQEYFEELLNVDPIENNNEEVANIVHPCVNVDPASDQITEDEIISTLRAMSNGKAGGEDELSVEIVKWAGPQVNLQHSIYWRKDSRRLVTGCNLCHLQKERSEDRLR